MVLKLEPFWRVRVPEDAFSSPWRDERFIVPGYNRKAEHQSEMKSWTTDRFKMLIVHSYHKYCEQLNTNVFSQIMKDAAIILVDTVI